MGAGLSLGLSLSAAGGEAGRDRVLGESGDLGDGDGERVADLIGDGNAGWRVDAVLVVVAVAAADEPDEPDEPDVFEQPVTAAATTTALAQLEAGGALATVLSTADAGCKS